MTTGLELMRKPFPPHQINRLPKGGVTLSYVGHAALTDRLLDADPSWSWEPVAFGEDGLPKLDANGGLWIRLTVCGVTRLGYGDSGDKKGPNAMKERIGDALRNAAMRFGAALDLWHKGELHIDEAVAEMEIAQPDYIKAMSLSESFDDLKRVFAEGWKATNGDPQIKKAYEAKKKEFEHVPA